MLRRAAQIEENALRSSLSGADAIVLPSAPPSDTRSVLLFLCHNVHHLVVHQLQIGIVDSAHDEDFTISLICEL